MQSHCNSSENNGKRTNNRTSSAADTASREITGQDATDSCNKRGRRHSSSLSAIVGNIGTRIKRSSSTVSSSSDGRISALQNSAPPGSLSTPPKRKNSSSTSDIPSENKSPNAPSRRRSTPINQRTTTETLFPASKNKKTSLRGIFSSNRKVSLQSDLNGDHKLPPRPPLFIKEFRKDSKTIITEFTSDTKLNTSDQEFSRNIGNGSTVKNDCPITTSSTFQTKNSSNNVCNTMSERRTRVHKHSLQQGNKWKLLQQKVLGNLDEENDDDDHDLGNNRLYGKVFRNEHTNSNVLKAS